MNSEDGFSARELALLDERLRDVRKVFPQQVENFLSKQTTKAKKMLVEKTEQQTKRKTGNLLKGIGRTRVDIFKGDVLESRVYNKANHAHLLEYGHEKVLWGDFTDEYVSGKHMMAITAKTVKSEMYDEISVFIDKQIKKMTR